MPGLVPPPILAATGSLGFDLLNLLLVLVAAWAAGRLAESVGYPGVLGELAAGIILGPPLLGLLSSGEGLATIGNLGIVLMMLYIGTEIDPADLRRASVPGLLAAAGGFIVPFVLGFAVVVLFGGTILAGLFVGSAVGVTSLATKSRILVDLGLLDTRIAYVLMAGALLSDTATLIVFAAIIGFVELGGFDLAGTATVAVEAIAFFAVTAAIGLLLLPRVGTWLRERGNDDRMLRFAVVVVTGLLFAELAEIAGLHAILGSFVAGMFLRGPLLQGRTGRDVNKLVHDVSIGFLAPVFFVTAGFEISFEAFRTDLGLLIAIVAVAVIGKIVGTALFYLPTGHGWREGVTVGAAMNGRGAVEIIIAGIGLELGLISREIFTILVFMAIITTAMVPVLLKIGVEWLRRHGELAKTEAQRRDIVIMGAGPVARVLAQELLPRAVRLIDRNPNRCARARRQGLTAIRGDGMDEETLAKAGAARAELFLALTSNSEVNVLAAQEVHEEFLVPNVYVAVHHTLGAGLERKLDRIGARPLLDGAVDMDMWDQWVSSGRAKPIRLEVHEGSQHELDVQLRSGRSGFPLVVNRNGEMIPYVLTTELQPGDVITVLALSDDESGVATTAFPSATPV
ncbi:MAG: cation:proton antiporter [Nitriliruptorales bacterium]|nr:cation:proton antiporter [Nitriliruptorales bacterium]